MQPLTYIVLHALLFRRYYFKISDLHSVVAGSGNNIQLLLSCQIDKLNCITGNTDSEVCILLFFRMLHSIDKFLFTEYVYIEKNAECGCGMCGEEGTHCNPVCV